MKLPNNITSIFMCGDIHGNFNSLFNKIQHLENCVLFLCGDIGLGFNLELERKSINNINNFLKEKNIYIIAIRGNHDNPNLFNDEKLNESIFSNWISIKDYTIVNVLNKNILCIGGGTSIDRLYRMDVGHGYWVNENVKYQVKVEEKIDIICSHTAPSFCCPLTKGNIVLQYAMYDENLLSDLDEERLLMDRIYEDYRYEITHWYYGHFHKSNSEIINNTMFKLLDIFEIDECCTDINNLL